MHCRRHAFPSVCRKCTQTRQSSTAAKLKDTKWDTASSNTSVHRSSPSPLMRKWASREPPFPSTASSSSSLGASKWTRPPQPPPTSGYVRGDTRAPSDWMRRIPSKPSESVTFQPTIQPAIIPARTEVKGLSAIGQRQRDLGRGIERGLAPHQIPQKPATVPNTRKRNSPQSKPPAAVSKAKVEIRSDEAVIEEEEDASEVSYEPDVDEEAGLKDPERWRSKHQKHGERGSILKTMGNTRFTITEERSTSEVKILKKRPRKAIVEKRVSPDIYIPTMISVGSLSQLLDVRLTTLQRAMRRAGMEDQMSYDHVLTADYAVLLAEEFGRNPIVDDELAFNLYQAPPHPDPSSLPIRPPVITIMGHVDHGKTTLLDTLRSTSVAKGEAGGITQHIGAFSVPVPGTRDTITFLDTPGHAAFSAMRARGARVTDIIVLVVAADDGIMPQTKEVIGLIQKEKGNIPFVVAINKVDKPGADVEAVQKALLATDVQLEEFGGDVPSVEVSGLTGKGLPTLVETLSAMAEMQEFRAEQDGPVHGYVLESQVQKGLGAVATVLVLRGCLKPGAHIVAGLSQGKVRVMSDSTGKAVKVAYPGMAVIVSGWKTIPSAGDEVLQGSESDVKKALANRVRQTEIEASLKDVEAINKARREERERREEEEAAAEAEEAAKEQKPVETGPKELKLVIKADVSGSAEAVVGAIHGIGNDVAISRVISSSVGDVSESDIMMAKAAGGTVVAFSVKVPKPIEAIAIQNQVPICSSGIIYRLVDDITARVVDLLPKIYETRVTGEAAVLQLFDISLKGGMTKKVAGSRVTSGLVEKNKTAKVLRNGKVIHEGTVDTMRIMKKEVTEIRKGTECGLGLAGYSGLLPGDTIQTYETIEKPGVL
ncbi:translation initiation factor IF-2 [Armillaria novae-zelandiae]|uniref:Translation initiation factor IF-2, mitochondrial n=1 Tax=Armillaria novae-zelandiae TaxID=153914 RepID=A0AA39U5P2_9AGAR|nr:translation initiation factor IF-2 [Armillaria novae-zelandiae]